MLRLRTAWKTQYNAHTRCASSRPTLTTPDLHLSKSVEWKNCDLEANFKGEVTREIESWGHEAYGWHYIRLERHFTDLKEKFVIYNVFIQPCCHQLPTSSTSFPQGIAAWAGGLPLCRGRWLQSTQGQSNMSSNNFVANCCQLQNWLWLPAIEKLSLQYCENLCC